MRDAPDQPLGGRRILVAEDEHLIAKRLVRELAAKGAQVVGPVATLERALALADAGPLDAAVLDINLRRQMVYPLADKLVSSGVPFVFATGYDAGAIPTRFAGVPRCEKPTSADAIADALQQQLVAT